MSTTDPLTIIAESYRSIAESTATLAATNSRLEAGQQQHADLLHYQARTLRQGQHLLGVLSGLLALALFGMAFLVWHSQAILTNTQTIAAQTQVLRERLEKR